LVGSYPFVCFPYFPFRNVERLRSIHGGPSVSGCPQARAEQCSPFAPAPLRSLRHYYGLLRPCAPHQYSDPRGGLPLGSLPSHRGDRFPRSLQEPGSESRRLHAGCRLGRNQDTPQTRPGLTTSPRFRHHLYAFDTSSAVCSRSSLRTIPDGIKSRLFRNVHHHGS
jgi:hypothetical protein